MIQLWASEFARILYVSFDGKRAWEPWRNSGGTRLLPTIRTIPLALILARPFRIS